MKKRYLTPEAMMAKAEKACSSARMLLDHGDSDGATNRAYYAMFDAARASLLASGAPVDLEKIRTHSGLIGAFGKFLVENGPVAKDMGRLLNSAREARMAADYDGVHVDPEDARNIVKHAETFVVAMRTEFMPEDDDGPEP